MRRRDQLRKLKEFERDFSEATEIEKRLAFRALVFGSTLYGLYRLAEKLFR